MFSSKQKDLLSRYQSPLSELSNRDLKLAGWYARHKELLRHMGIGILLVFVLITMGYSIYGWGSYLFFGYGSDERVYQELVVGTTDYTALQLMYRAQPLTIGSTDIYSSGADSYDFVTDITNPNPRHIAFLTYKHHYDSAETAPATTIILPGIRQPVVSFGVDDEGFPGTADFILVNVEWRRIDPHGIPNPTAYMQERLQLIVDNIVFTPTQPDQNQFTNSVQFTVLNESVYNFWNVPFIVELLNGDVREGVHYTELYQFGAGQERKVDIRSLVSNLNVDDVRLYPVVDVFDPNEFMKPGE